MNKKAIRIFSVITAVAFINCSSFASVETVAPEPIEIEEEALSPVVIVGANVREEEPDPEPKAVIVEIEEEVEETPISPFSDEDIDLIALVTMAEAEGESEYGKRLVIDTILNRIDSEKFPNTASGVIYQRHQFSSMWNGRVDRCYVRDDIRQLVIEESINRTNYDVMFFTAGRYGKYGTPIFQVENHYFSSY